MTASTMTTQLAAYLASTHTPPSPGVTGGDTWAAGYLAELPLDAPVPILRRAAVGVGLGTTHGLALGLVGNVGDMAAGAAWVASSLLMVVVMAMPALHVLLALFDLPVSPLRTAERASRALFRIGLLLAGAAPATALYATTANVDVTLGLGVLAMYAACSVGLYDFTSHLWGVVLAAESRARAGGAAALVGFVLFAIALVSRLTHDLTLGGSL